MKRRHKSEKILKVKIERIVPNGYGIGFAEGLTIFAPLTAAGDKVKVQIERQKGKIVWANLIEILEPSADRIEPPCPYFGRCGGCDFQQMNPAAQLRAKTEIVRDCLRRIGKIDFPGEIEIVPSPVQWNYRTRVQWKCEKNKLGYFARNSHRVIDVEVCPIIAPPLQKQLAELRENLRELNFNDIQAVSGGNSVSLRAGKETNDFEENFYAANKELAEESREIQNAPPNLQANVVSLKIGEFEYEFSADTFFQVNHDILPEVIETAIGDANGDVALDLYCGVGLFSLPLAKRFGQVFAVEGNQTSIEFARKNAGKAGLKIFAETALVGEWLQKNTEKFGKIDFVLLDPPRAGAEKTTIENLIRLKPKEIVYVSCNPATLARDLKMLLESGVFTIEQIRAFDFFPQTHHVETVVHLKSAEFPSKRASHVR